MSKHLILSENLEKSTNFSNENLYKIVQKIEKINSLKEKNKLLEEKINEIKNIFDSKTEAHYPNFIKAKKEILKSYFNRYKQKSFSGIDKSIIADFIQEEFEILINFKLLDDELKQMHKEFLQYQTNALSKEELDYINKTFAEDFKRNGYDMPEDFDYANMFENQEEVFKEFAKQEASRQEKIKHKEKKEKALNTDLDFQKIYKFLVKKIHPDKNSHNNDEELMKELTTAWEQRNYYKILLLWIEIDPENTLQIDFTPKNFKSITKSLNKEIMMLEHEEYMIKNQHQDTGFLYQNFYAKLPKTIEKKVNLFIEKLTRNLAETKKRIETINNTKAFKEVLKQEKQYNAQSSIFDLFPDSFFEDNFKD